MCSPSASTELAMVHRSCVNIPAKSGGASPLHQVPSQAALVLVLHNKSFCVCACGAPVGPVLKQFSVGSTQIRLTGHGEGS